MGAGLIEGKADKSLIFAENTSITKNNTEQKQF
jgi:hypothetical protein